MKFTDERAAEICRLITEGKSLIEVCAADDMPDRSTIFDWLDARPAFADLYARARARQAEYMDDLILGTAKGSKPETAASDRVKIDAFKWRAAKLKPRRYGDMTRHELTGKDGGPIRTHDLSRLPDEKLTALAALLDAGSDAGGSAGGDPEASGAEGA